MQDECVSRQGNRLVLTNCWEDCVEFGMAQHVVQASFRHAAKNPIAVFQKREHPIMPKKTGAAKSPVRKAKPSP
jgi:hypothetical protein